MKIHIVKHLKLYAYEIIKENKDKKTGNTLICVPVENSNSNKTSYSIGIRREELQC